MGVFEVLSRDVCGCVVFSGSEGGRVDIGFRDVSEVWLDVGVIVEVDFGVGSLGGDLVDVAVGVGFSVGV